MEVSVSEPSHARRALSELLARSIADDVHDDGGRGHDRRVIDRMRAHPGLHSSRHEALCFGQIMRSCSATRNQVGRSFHNGRSTAR